MIWLVRSTLDICSAGSNTVAIEGRGLSFVMEALRIEADRGIQLAKLGADRGGPRLILGRIDQLGDVPIVAQGDQLILERASLVGVRIRHLLRCDSAMAVQPPLILPPRAIKVGRRQRNELAVLPLVRRRTARAHVGQDSLHEGIQLQPLPGLGCLLSRILPWVSAPKSVERTIWFIRLVKFNWFGVRGRT
ncbi:hypothetical protein [Pseudoxanthomonas mexicana]